MTDPSQNVRSCFQVDSDSQGFDHSEQVDGLEDVRK